MSLPGEPINGDLAGVPRALASAPRLIGRVSVFAPRSSGFMRSGFRAQAWIDRQMTAEHGPLVHDVVVYFEGGALAAGDTGWALIFPLLPELWPDLRSGARFELWEGKPSGAVEVLAPLRQETRSSDA